MQGVEEFPKWVRERFYITENDDLIYADDQVVFSKKSVVNSIEMLDTFTVYTENSAIRFKRHPKHILTIITK